MAKMITSPNEVTEEWLKETLQLKLNEDNIRKVTKVTFVFTDKCYFTVLLNSVQKFLLKDWTENTRILLSSNWPPGFN